MIENDMKAMIIFRFAIMIVNSEIWCMNNEVATELEDGLATMM